MIIINFVVQCSVIWSFSINFVEITKSQHLIPQLCFQKDLLSKFACVVTFGVVCKWFEQVLKHRLVALNLVLEP